MASPKEALAIMIGRAKPMAKGEKPMGKMMGKDEYAGDLEAAGEALISAINSGNAKAVGEALKSAITLCGGE